MGFGSHRVREDDGRRDGRERRRRYASDLKQNEKEGKGRDGEKQGMDGRKADSWRPEQASSQQGHMNSDEEEDEQMKIKDETETSLVYLRRTIYLTIMSSVDFEEAGHKLLKSKLEAGQEVRQHFIRCS